MSIVRMRTDKWCLTLKSLRAAVTRVDKLRINDIKEPLNNYKKPSNRRVYFAHNYFCNPAIFVCRYYSNNITHDAKNYNPFQLRDKIIALVLSDSV